MSKNIFVSWRVAVEIVNGTAYSRDVLGATSRRGRSRRDRGLPRNTNVVGGGGSVALRRRSRLVEVALPVTRHPTCRTWSRLVKRMVPGRG